VLSYNSGGDAFLTQLEKLIMNKHQIKLAHQLLASIDHDEIAMSDAETYGGWVRHLADHLSDIHIEQCRQLTGINS